MAIHFACFHVNLTNPDFIAAEPCMLLEFMRPQNKRLSSVFCRFIIHAACAHLKRVFYMSKHSLSSTSQCSNKPASWADFWEEDSSCVAEKRLHFLEMSPFPSRCQVSYLLAKFHICNLRCLFFWLGLHCGIDLDNCECSQTQATF